MKKIILTIAVLMFLSASNFTAAQVNKVTLGVDGFTCSLCAKGVEGQLKSLDFIETVKTDLKNTLFILTFKTGKKIDVRKISEAVDDGGFTVRDIVVEGKGTLKGNMNTEYFFSSANSGDITLQNVPDSFAPGDKVSIKGKANYNTNTIIVGSIKKL